MFGVNVNGNLKCFEYEMWKVKLKLKWMNMNIKIENIF